MREVTKNAARIRLAASNYQNIPKGLREQKSYIFWRLEPVINNSKLIKIPINPSTLNPGGQNNPDCFIDLEEAVTRLQLEESQIKPRFHGIGLAFHNTDTIGIDLDHVYDENGSLKPLAKDLLENLEGFVEESISGNGFHVITKTDDPSIKNSINTELGLDIFRNNSFIALTGLAVKTNWADTFPSSPVNLNPLKKYLQTNTFAGSNDLDNFKKPDPNWSLERVENELLNALPNDLSYPKWLEVGMCLHFQFDGSYDAFEAFDRFSLRGANYPTIGEQSTFDKWESFGKSNGRAQKTIGTLIALKKTQDLLNQYQTSGSEPLLSKLKDERHKIKKIDWIVDGMIKQGSLVMLGGEPAGGKTYVAIEMMLAVASGKPMFDQFPTKQGEAIYIACEGRDSVLRRVTAWLYLKNDGDDVDGAYISRQEMAILVPEAAEVSSEAMSEFINTQGIKPKVLFIDTMNYSLGSAKENDSNDMTEYFRRVSNNLIRRFGCTVVLVHHTSKDGSDIRGSSAIRGALDSLFFVSRDKNGLFKVKNDKHKDREKLPDFFLEAKEVSFDLPDGSMESNIALFPQSKVTQFPVINIAQKECLDILEREVGIGGSMMKSELLKLLQYPSATNASRDLFNPLVNENYIQAIKTKVTLLKTVDVDAFD